MALWSGRFRTQVDEDAQEFGASLSTDWRMFAEDVEGSIAHAKMLAKQGIIPEDDALKIVAGLEQIRQQIEDGTFEFHMEDEDIHMSIERALTEQIGNAGARLHTARSRNDQVATDTRLYVKRRIKELMEANANLRSSLLAKAKENQDTVMPGYTHMQHGQPIYFAHHLLAYFWMFSRDFTRLQAAYDAADANPLGSCALAGTTYPIDREFTTQALGFSHAIPNSIDAVSDRDYLLDLLYAASVSSMHLSRLCEELVLWSTSEFGFVTMSDSFSTGSSIMPQKKNPDFAELVRGKSGRVIGDLVSLLVICKGLPLSYNKDMQEDKEAAMDAVDTLLDCCNATASMVATMGVNEDAMLKQVSYGHVAATDVADYLAKRGMPFRHAHEVAGHLVLICDERGCELRDLAMDDFKAESELFEDDIMDVLDPRSIADARESYGGTGRSALAAQMAEAEASLECDESRLG